MPKLNFLGEHAPTPPWRVCCHCNGYCWIVHVLCRLCVLHNIVCDHVLCMWPVIPSLSVYQCTNYLGVETSWDLGDQSVGHQLVGHVSRTCHSHNTSAGHVTAATTPFTPPIFLYSGTIKDWV